MFDKYPNDANPPKLTGLIDSMGCDAAYVGARWAPSSYGFSLSRLRDYWLFRTGWQEYSLSFRPLWARPVYTDSKGT